MSRGHLARAARRPATVRRAARARANLESHSSVEVRQGDGSAPLGETFDVILVHAGVTHPLEVWLDALRPHGRMVLPITATMPRFTRRSACATTL